MTTVWNFVTSRIALSYLSGEQRDLESEFDDFDFQGHTASSLLLPSSSDCETVHRLLQY